MLIYLTAINIIGFIIMGIDKQRAKNNQWRIRERTLFLVAMIGGSIGIFLGMEVFRHKTKHKKFTFGIPIIILVQITIISKILLKW